MSLNSSSTNILLDKYFPALSPKNPPAIPPKIPKVVVIKGARGIPVKTVNP